jgi:heme-degrading monooxygenase HmoA
MDSVLILEYAEALAAPGRSLMPAQIHDRQLVLHQVGLALAACEKSVQLVYEQELRPIDKQHAPWVQRVTGQLLAACQALETALQRHPLSTQKIDQAGVSIAVAWQFIQQTMPEVVPAAQFPALAAWSAQAETLPAFLAAPHGDSTCVPSAEAALPASVGSHVLIIHAVKGYTAWKKVFDEAAAMRKSAGEQRYQLLRFDHDTHQVVHFSQWSSLSRARAFFESAELAALRERAGAEAPQFLYLKALEQGLL